MVQKNLTKIVANVKGVEIYEDLNDNIKTTGIAVDDDAYDTGTFIDRDYDVRALDGFMIKLENLDSTDGFTYVILSTTKDFAKMDTDLVDADFSETAATEANVVAGAKSATYTTIRVTPDITAIRLRAKRQISPNDSLLRADIRGF